MRWSRLTVAQRTLLIASAAYLGLAIVWAAPSSLSPTDTVPDLGDPLHLAWVMAWDAHQILRRPWALFASNSFYPYPRSLAFGDHLLPEALLVAPVFWATGNAVLASNVAVVLALLLSAISMFVLVRAATGWAGAAFVSGLAYAFNSFTLHELPRVHVLSLQWWPLALLFLDRLAREGRPRAAWLFVLALLLQALSGSYYLVYTLLVAPPWLAGAYLAARRRPRAPEARGLSIALVVAVLAAAAILWPYVWQLRALGFEKGWAGGADLLSYLDPGSRNWLWARFHIASAKAELPHFLGFGGAALMLLGAFRVLRGKGQQYRVVGPLAVMTSLVGLVLSLGPLIHIGGVRVGGGPYDLLYWHVPLLRGMASPERVGVLVLLGGSILLGIGVHGLLALWPAPARRAALAVLAVLLPLEHWSPWTGAGRRGVSVPTGSSLPGVYRWLSEGEGSREPVIELPLYPERSKKLWAAYLYYSTYHWRPIPIGRTSFYPPAHDYLAASLGSFPDDSSLALLDRLGLRTVVVHPLVWDAAQRSRRLEELDADPRLQRVQTFEAVVPGRFAALGLGEERVYRVLGGGAPPKEPCQPTGELPRDGWTFRHTGVNKPERVRDGDRRTSWFTDHAQKPGDRIEVFLDRPDVVAAAALELDYPHEEFPRNLLLFLQAEDGRWVRTRYADGVEERWATLEGLLKRPREARLVLRFPPREARAIRLTVGFREEDPAWPRWSVAELRLYRECR